MKIAKNSRAYGEVIDDVENADERKLFIFDFMS